MIRIVFTTALAILISSGSVLAQTKKIANASHGSHGPTFNWYSSDNLGEIMDYDKIRQYRVQYDSMTIDSLIYDSTAVVETVTIDTNSKVKNECQPGDSNLVIKKKIKTIKKKKRKKAKANKPNDQSSETGLLKAEIIQTSSQPTEHQNKADMSMWFLLLVFPVGYLMIKKS